MSKQPDSFADRAIRHLGNYKRDVLGVREPGAFFYKGRLLEKAHILPSNQADLNLLPLIRADFAHLREASGKKLKPHKYFHHLNSSQALAINLFHPFLSNPDRLELLQTLLGLRGTIERAGFEYIPDEQEGTNVDFFATDVTGSTVLVEVKFTEVDFGKAKNDQAHREKFDTIYRDRLRGVARLSGDERCEFFAAYQFFRNAIFASDQLGPATIVCF